MTRADRIDKICDTPIAAINVRFTNVNLTDKIISIRVHDGSMIKANGTIKSSYDHTIYNQYSSAGPSITNMILEGYVTHVDCLSSGSAKVNGAGGVGNYNIEWNTGATTAEINNLSQGIYTVTVSDANGLTSNLSVEVEDDYLPIYDHFGNTIPCNEFECPTVIDFIGSLPNGSHHASQAINTDAIVNSSYNSSLKAGNVLRLLPGFSVEVGSTFSLAIEACND